MVIKIYNHKIKHQLTIEDLLPKQLGLRDNLSVNWKNQSLGFKDKFVKWEV